MALARRLSGVLWAMWRDGTLYDAQSAAAASAKGLRLQAQSVEQQAQAIKRATAKAHRRQRSIDKGLADATRRSSPTVTTPTRAKGDVHAETTCTDDTERYRCRAEAGQPRKESAKALDLRAASSLVF
ncbi:hypothetical protein WMF04_11460 [Sorangium sp. So ce260]|uniref:hypothetical protein n=1 Tax=Sorangium sp. So ce260 TaxID=3133291 RepID=UPI003F60C461